MRRSLLLLLGTFVLLSAFSNKRKSKPKLPAEFVYIPAGTMSLSANDDSQPGKEKVVSLTSFYLSKYEVTNIQYRQFIAEMQSSMDGKEL